MADRVTAHPKLHGQTGKWFKEASGRLDAGGRALAEHTCGSGFELQSNMNWMPVTLAFREREDQEFKIILDYVSLRSACACATRTSVTKNTKKNQPNKNSGTPPPRK